ncbi:MAG TPA: hypothetical protein VND68_08650, partial [Chloroflexia bacterium]|nr:hypothetical protein [Chloroflexia bacterium]
MKPWLPEEAASKRGRARESAEPVAAPTSVTAERTNGHAEAPPAPPVAPRADGHTSGDGTPAVVSLPAPAVDAVQSPVAVDGGAPGVKPEPVARASRGQTPEPWLWRTKGFWLGGIGLAFAMNAQKVLIVDHEVVGSIRWYALAIFLVLVAWLGTYRNKSVLAEVMREERVERKPRARTSPLPTRTAAAP